MKMKKAYTKIVLVGVFLSVSCLADTKDDYVMKVVEKKPSKALSTKVQSMFAKANQISVKYAPNANMGRIFSEKEALEHKWRYMFSYRCAITCEDNANKIQAYLSSGLKLEGDCPVPYYAVIELHDSTEVVHKIYIQQSGKCFTLSGSSFYTAESFDGFVYPPNLYPDFVN